MAFERSIIKAEVAAQKTFEFKPQEIGGEISEVARQYVDGPKPSDFKLSDLIAQQAGISQLESDKQKDKLNAQVLERLKEVEEQAYKNGYDLGLIEGTEKAFQEAKSDLVERLAAFAEILKGIETLKSRLHVDNESELINLVFLTAKRLALRDLEVNREAVTEILRNVVSEMQGDERITVRLAAEDLYFIETLQDKTEHRLENFERIKFITDEKIKPGGCMIETAYGTIDATIEERLERTWQTLQSKIPQKPRERKDD